MNLAVGRLYEARERFDVGREQFPHGPVLQNLIYDGMLVGQIQKSGLLCGIGAVVVLLRLVGELQLLEKHGPDLFRRRDVQRRITGHFPDPRLPFQHLLPKMFREVFKGSEIDPYPVALHLGKNLEKRFLHRVVKACDRGFLHVLADSFRKEE